MCKIKRNSAKCNECGTDIESKTRWDFVSCPCNAIFVDGGREYLRRGWNGKGDPQNFYVDTSEFVSCMQPDCHYIQDAVTLDQG